MATSLRSSAWYQTVSCSCPIMAPAGSELLGRGQGSKVVGGWGTICMPPHRPAHAWKH